VRAGTQFCPACGQNLAQPAAVVGVAAVGNSGAAGLQAADMTLTRMPRFVLHWEELKRLAWIFGLFLATSFVFGIAWRSIHSPWVDVAASVAQALIVIVAVATRWSKVEFLFKFHGGTVRDALVLILISVVFVALAAGYFELLQHLGVPIHSSTSMFIAAGWPIWSIFLLVSILPAVLEEIAFRGVIQSSLERMLNARDAWLIQAALFSVLHLHPLMFPSHFLMGLCFGYMRRRSRSIYPGMLLHACWNGLVVLQELT
jgi:membrane protease YdiL (CAAX protease family)